MKQIIDFDVARRREWEAQERAVREEREAAPESGGALVDQYRLIARVLRHPTIARLPSDFARETTARIELLAQIADETFEIWLQRALVTLLLLAGTATLLLFDGGWQRSFILPADNSFAVALETITDWSAVVVGCLGLSWALERWHSKTLKD